MSMFKIGLSGLQSTQSALQVTSNNIANSATAGFKSGSSRFSAVYSGGQQGGVNVTGMKENFSKTGDAVKTNNALDLAIQGKGFYIISQQGQTAYTQAGQFEFNSDKQFITPTGAKLQGYGVDENGQLMTDGLTDLQLTDSNLPAAATTKVDFSLNLSSASKTITATFDPADGSTYNYSRSTEVFDSLGNSHNLTQYFVHTGSNQWTAHYYVDNAPVPDPNKPGSNLSQALTFDGSGKLTSPSPAKVALQPSVAAGGADAMKIELDLAGSTQYGNGFTMYNNDANGYTAGQYAGVKIDEEGKIFAMFSNGETKIQGQIVLADFANVDGLEPAGNTSWYASSGSGEPLLDTPGGNKLGSIKSGVYIGSNVDISEELVDLMSFQQNYQANAKTISSADEMMQILFSAT